MSYFDAEIEMRNLGWIVSVNEENILFEKKNYGLEMKVLVGKDPEDLYFVSIDILRDGKLVGRRRCGPRFVNSPYNKPTYINKAFYAWAVPLMLEF